MKKARKRQPDMRQVNKQQLEAMKQRIRQERKRREGNGGAAGDPEVLYKTTDEAGAELEKGLKLMPGDEADGIIGENDAIDPILLDAMKAEAALLFAAARELGGMKRTSKALEAFSKGLLIRMHLVHGAYALGICEGMRRARQSDGE